MAIADSDSRARLTELAQEQAALRRVATLVAAGTPPEQLFTAVTVEIGRLLPVEYVYMGRYEPDEMLTIVASWGTVGERFRVGRRGKIGGKNLVTRVFESSRPGTNGQFRRRVRCSGRSRARVRVPVRSGDADPRRRQPMGGSDRRNNHGAAHAAGDRDATRFVHRAAGDGDRER